MRTAILLSLIVCALSTINDSPTPTWEGTFTTVLSCQGNCCCPNLNQNYVFVPLGWTVNLIGTFQDTDVCTKLGVSSKRSITPLPFKSDNAFSLNPVLGKNNQIFNNWFIVPNYPYLGPDGNIQNVTLASIEIDQTAIGGDDSCLFRFIKN